MCLAVLALHHLANIPVLIAANRDEFHERPTQAAAAWPGEPRLYAGRDLRAGGTWMGVTENGRYAIVTNFRDPGNLLNDAPSRGALVEDYLRSDASPAHYLAAVYERGSQYNGFNLIVGDTSSASYLSNRDGAPRVLTPGVYALSNHLLDTPWPKLTRVKTGFERILQAAPQPDLPALYANLADRTPADEADLPSTGIPLERERLVHRHARSTGICEDYLDAVPHKRLNQDIGPGHGFSSGRGLAVVDSSHVNPRVGLWESGILLWKNRPRDFKSSSDHEQPVGVL